MAGSGPGSVATAAAMVVDVEKQSGCRPERTKALRERSAARRPSRVTTGPRGGCRSYDGSTSAATSPGVTVEIFLLGPDAGPQSDGAWGAARKL